MPHRSPLPTPPADGQLMARTQDGLWELWLRAEKSSPDRPWAFFKLLCLAPVRKANFTLSWRKDNSLVANGPDWFTLKEHYPLVAKWVVSELTVMYGGPRLAPGDEPDAGH